jgi:hypothetical protein
MIKSILLAGASALAVAATAAQADTFSAPGQYAWTAPTTGKYRVEVWGAQGGSGMNGSGGSYAGGLGAGSYVNLRLTAGQSLYLFVGARGQDGYVCGCGAAGGGGGGGSSGVMYSLGGFGPDFALVMGGGGGGGNSGAGGDGVHVSVNGHGADGKGFLGGYRGIYGAPGTYGYWAGGGGGIVGYGYSVGGAGFLEGGGGGHYYGPGGSGGSGWSGGGGGFYGGGGGGGVSGGGGGGSAVAPPPVGIVPPYGAGGGGGGSALAAYGRNGALAKESGDGLIVINPAAPTPEPADWMLLLTGVGITGYMLRRERARRVQVFG